MSNYSDYTTQTARVESLGVILGINNLHSITLGGELAIAAGRFLHMIAHPSAVTELQVDGRLMSCALQVCPSLEWDEMIAAKFAALRSLHLSNIQLDIDLDVSSRSNPSMIRTLVLDNVEILSGQLACLVNENETLEQLSVSTDNAAEYDQHIRTMLASCGIRSLEYEVKDGGRGQMPLFDHETRALATLRHLRLEGVYVDEEMLGRIGEVCEGLKVVVVNGQTQRSMRAARMY
ncbi:hypothetical protein AX17_000254 [Amanita inopinata Kibby_2008]|nr:hypothetical protein AX17_000254 [Amanita inopinata Kibby_2008]